MADIKKISSRVPFLVNFIVTHIDVYKIEEPQFAVVSVNFNNVPLNITPSRINVNEFNSNCAILILESPEKLRRNLESAGPLVNVKYKGESVGTGEFTFPQAVIDRINKGMNDILHSDTVRIDRRGMDMGTVELLCFLTVKCEEIQVLETCNRCGNLGKSVNPTDMMFVVGAPQPCQAVCEPCEDELVPEKGDDMLNMDLSRYTKPNRRANTPPTPSLTACTNLKAITKQYSDIIDTFLKKVKSMPSTKINERILKKDFSNNRDCPRQEYVDRSIRVPLGDMEHLGIKPIRFCPVCLTSISYQPKYGRCPNCLNKAMPDIDSIPRDSLTVDQIMDEVIKPDPCDAQPSADKHCCCKEGKMCTHCRVRKAFTEACDIRPRVKQECPRVEPNQNEDFCVQVHPNSPEKSCRPYLEHVFDELRNLYKQRDEGVNSDLVNRFGRLSVGPADIEKFKRESVGPKTSGSPSFMRTKPKRPKFGHKTCLDRAGIVPRRHGWAWMSTKAAKCGWRPGAVSRNTGIIMRFFLNSPEQNENGAGQNMEREANRKQPIILNICKKNGAIYITLNAVRNPHIEMKPIVFKIVKSDLAVALRQIKKKLKSMGFRKCVCHNSVMLCVCRDNLEKKHLECALQKECKRRRIANCVDQLVLTDTSESEMEYNLDVTPPIPDSKPLLAIKPCTKSMGTQIDPADLKPLPHPFAAPLDPYWRAYDCALGSRKPVVQKIELKPNCNTGPFKVRMLKRYYDNLKKKAQAEKDALAAEIARKKKGIDLMKYLMEDGTLPFAWDPNNPNPKVKPKLTSKRLDYVMPMGPIGLPEKDINDPQDFARGLPQYCPYYCYL